MVSYSCNFEFIIQRELDFHDRFTMKLLQKLRLLRLKPNKILLENSSK